MRYWGIMPLTHHPLACALALFFGRQCTRLASTFLFSLFGRAFLFCLCSLLAADGTLVTWELRAKRFRGMANDMVIPQDPFSYHSRTEAVICVQTYLYLWSVFFAFSWGSARCRRWVAFFKHVS